MRSHFTRLLVIVALLGLIAVPTTTLGQQEDNAKPKAAKSKDKAKKAPKGQQAKDAGKNKGSGDAKSKLDRLELAMAKELKRTSWHFRARSWIRRVTVEYSWATLPGCPRAQRWRRY